MSEVNTRIVKPMPITGSVVISSGVVASNISGQRVFVVGQSGIPIWTDQSGVIGVTILSGLLSVSSSVSGQPVRVADSGGNMPATGIPSADGYVASVTNRGLNTLGFNLGFNDTDGNWKRVRVNQSGLLQVSIVEGSITSSVSGQPVKVSGETVRVASGDAISSIYEPVSVARNSGQLSRMLTDAIGNLQVKVFSIQSGIVVAKISGETVSTSISGNAVDTSGSAVSIGASNLLVTAAAAANTTTLGNGAAALNTLSSLYVHDPAASLQRRVYNNKSGQSALQVASSGLDHLIVGDGTNTITISLSRVMVTASGNHVVAKISGETIHTSVSGNIITAKISGEIVGINSGLYVSAIVSGTLNTAISGETVVIGSGGEVVGKVVLANQAGSVVGLAGTLSNGLVAQNSQWVLGVNYLYDQEANRFNRWMTNLSGQQVAVVATSGSEYLWARIISGDIRTSISGNHVIGKISGETVLTSISGNVVIVLQSGTPNVNIRVNDTFAGTLRDLKVARSGVGALAVATSGYDTVTLTSGIQLRAHISGDSVSTSVSGNLVGALVSGTVIGKISGERVAIVGTSGLPFWQDASGILGVTILSGSLSSNISGQTVVAKISGETVSSNISGNTVFVASSGREPAMVLVTSAENLGRDNETLLTTSHNVAEDLAQQAWRHLAVNSSGKNALQVASSGRDYVWVKNSGESIKAVGMSGIGVWQDASGVIGVTILSGNISTTIGSGLFVVIGSGHYMSGLGVQIQSGVGVSTSISGNNVQADVSGSPILAGIYEPVAVVRNSGQMTSILTDSIGRPAVLATQNGQWLVSGTVNAVILNSALAVFINSGRLSIQSGQVSIMSGQLIAKISGERVVAEISGSEVQFVAPTAGRSRSTLILNTNSGGTLFSSGDVVSARIKAPSRNSGDVYIGFDIDGERPFSGYGFTVLEPGDAVDLDIDNLARLRAFGVVSGFCRVVYGGVAT